MAEYHTFGPGLVLDPITTTGIAATTAVLEDAETGDSVQAFTMDDDPQETTVTTNRVGYFPQFKVPGDVNRLRLRFGNIILENSAWELVTGAALAAIEAQAIVEDIQATIYAQSQDAIHQVISDGTYRMPGRTARVISSTADPVNFTSNGTMQFPALQIVSGRDRFNVPAGAVDFSGSASSTRAVAIFYDPAANEILGVGTTSIGSTHATMIMLGVFYTVSGNYRRVWFAGDFTVDGRNQFDVDHILYALEVPGANVVPEYRNGQIAIIRHQINGATIRYDEIERGANEIIETRQFVPTGKTITLTTNMITKVTEVSQ